MKTGKLSIVRSEDDGKTHIEIRGSIDETADLKGLFTGITKQVTLDLEGIELINSAGVREWVRTIAKIPAGLKIIWEKCSPRIVEQLNYVSNFLGEGEVDSFYAPYFCPKCKTEKSVLLKTADVRTKGSPPKPKCERCKSALSFDDVEEEYFAFIHATN